MIEGLECLPDRIGMIDIMLDLQQVVAAQHNRQQQDGGEGQALRRGERRAQGRLSFLFKNPSPESPVSS